jgi:guanylate kinase
LKTKIENAVFIFIVPPSLAILRERLQKRETESLHEIEVRLKNAKEELQYFKFYDYIVVNNMIDDAIKDFKAIIRAEMCKTLRMEERLKW